VTSAGLTLPQPAQVREAVIIVPLFLLYSGCKPPAIKRPEASLLSG
jgi:hypothetical protein